MAWFPPAPPALPASGPLVADPAGSQPILWKMGQSQGGTDGEWGRQSLMNTGGRSLLEVETFT